MMVGLIRFYGPTIQVSEILCFTRIQLGMNLTFIFLEWDETTNRLDNCGVELEVGVSCGVFLCAEDWNSLTMWPCLKIGYP